MAPLESCACAAKIGTSRCGSGEVSERRPERGGWFDEASAKTLPCESPHQQSPSDAVASDPDETRDRDTETERSRRLHSCPTFGRGMAEQSVENRWEGRPRPRQARTTEGNLEGEQGPGRTGQRTPSKALAGTDCLAEQGLGGPIPRRYDNNDDAGNSSIAKVADRRRSKVRGGKGERRRAPAAGEESPSRGMKLDAGKVPAFRTGAASAAVTSRDDHSDVAAPGAGNHQTKVRKRIEPHDWQQDATSLRVIQRNKPTKS